MGSPRKSHSTLNMPARLLDCQFVRIHADTGPGVDNMKGGTIRANIDAGLQRGADNKVLATVKIDLTGVPQGSSEKSSTFAFKIGLTLAGIFEWEDPKSFPIDLKENPIAAQLCQQLYPLAIAEAKAVAQRLGFNNLELPWQLGNKPEKTVASPVKPRHSNRAVTKKKKAA